MSLSVVHYQFKNDTRRWDTISFEGSVISCLNLKRRIVKAKKLGKQNGDFDLMIRNAQTGEGKLERRYVCMSVFT